MLVEITATQTTVNEEVYDENGPTGVFEDRTINTPSTEIDYARAEKVEFADGVYYVTYKED